MTISIKLVDSIATIKKDIHAAIAEEMNKRIKTNSKRFATHLKQSIRAWLVSQPEMVSLQTEGSPFSLHAQFGLLPGQGHTAADAIIDAVAQSIEIKAVPFTKNLKGRVEIAVQPKDFRAVLGIPQGTVLTDKGAVLEWLNWLLFEGDRVIIIGYEYTPDGGGRSGGGTMTGGVGWRIHPNFAGTVDDNFITRALVTREKEMTTLVQQLFT